MQRRSLVFGLAVSLPAFNGCKRAAPGFGPKHEEIAKTGVTFEKARENPELRQQYLNQLAKRLGVPTIRRIVYTDSPEYAAEIGKEMLELGLSRNEFYKIEEMNRDNTAFVATLLQTIGKRKNSNIYMKPETFSYSEKLTESIIAHEKRHTEQYRHGIKIGDILLDYSNFGEYSLRLVHAAMECDGYAEQIKAMEQNGARREIMQKVLRTYHLFNARMMMLYGNENNAANKDLIRNYFKYVFKPVENIVYKYVREEGKNGPPTWVNINP